MAAFILRNENAIYHECGFSCDNVYYLSLGEKSYFITDSRYTFEAKESVQGAVVIEGYRRDLLKTVKKLLKQNGIKKIHFDPEEWSVAAYERVQKSLHVKWIPKSNFSQKRRIIKSEKEIKILKKAVKFGAEAFDRFADFINEKGIGLTEEELHFEAENIFKDRGRFGLSFSPIVALNENAAKPHALPSKKVLKKGDLLLVDGGVLFKRYCSDRTRTVEVDGEINFSKKQTFKNKTRQKVYDIVLKAQEASIKAAKPGMLASEVDKIGRDIITKAGYGDFFIHSTGHGVGVDIHELPVIGASSKDVLEEGMVFTIEPGIYLPNEFGVRIEDMLLVTKNGVKVL